LQFLNNLPFYGKAFLCSDNENIRSLLPLPHIKTIKYGAQEEYADIFAKDITLNPDHSIFTVYEKGSTQPLGTVKFMMPGKHNVLNALAAIAVSRDLDISFETISNALLNFGGIDRRFTFKGIYRGAELFDDYGHHPEEINQTLFVAERRKKNKLIVIFQPHRYTRTQHLWDFFIHIFLTHQIDHLIITDIYPASEASIPGISSEIFTNAILKKNPICSVTYVPYEQDFSAMIKVLDTVIKPNDLVLFQGAGKINKLATQLCAEPLPTQPEVARTLL
ncbi:MAG: glutamate ligase domain-containing protein, partial [Candidatus Babeliales bacterium]